MAYKFNGEIEVLKGIGLPRLTTVQRTGYTPVATGFMVYDTTLEKPFVYDITATAWVGLGSAANARRHMTNAVLTTLPYVIATTGKPTVGEIGTYVTAMNTATAGSFVDTLAYYTGGNISTATPTYVYWVDAAGIVTEIQTPDRFGIADWTTATYYQVGAIVKTPAGAIVRRTTAGTSLGTYTLDIATWTLVQNGSHLSVFPTTAYVYAGQTFYDATTTAIYQKTASGATLATFILDVANWTKIAELNGDIANWMATTVYSAGQTAIAPDGSLISANADQTSAATFSTLEAATWTRLGQADTKAFAPSTYYFAGSKATNAGRTLIRGTAGTSGLTLTLAEAGSWTLDNQNSIGAYAASTVVMPNELMVSGNIVYQRILVGTTGAVFNAVEEALWTRLTTKGANARRHVTNTALTTLPLTLATAGSPTVGEITAYVTATNTTLAGSFVDTLAYYTGGDLSTATPTHVYWVDTAGVVTILEKPAIAGVQNNFAAIIAPTATDDSAAGYVVGSHWVDTVANKTYVCVDSTTLTAIWDKVTNIKSNFVAIIAPTTTDGVANGYEVGSRWVDVAGNKAYVCVDSTATAAIWVEMGVVKNNFVATTAPLATSDSAAGYVVGSHWFNTAASTLYVCVDSTALAAVWELLNSIKHNFAATVDPTATNDLTTALTGGYEVASLWFNTSTSNLFVCVDSTSTAAKWEMVNSVKNNFAAVAGPATTDGVANGYEVGSTWIDILANRAYVCVDATLTAAIWIETGATKNNFVAIVAPTVTTGSNLGYSTGSHWFDTATSTLYVCTNNSPTAAKWELINTLQNNFAAIIAPTATDGSAIGYEVGSRWIDITGNASYVCVDSTAIAAIWVKTGTGSNIANWVAATAYDVGQVVVSPDGSLVKAGLTATSTATFNAAEITALGWVSLGQVDIKPFAASRYYFAGAKATLNGIEMSRTVGVSALTFTLIEAASWTFESQNTIGAYAAGVTLAGTVIVDGTILWQRAATGTAAATFTTAEKLLWTQLTSTPTVQYEALIANALLAWGTAAAGYYTVTVTALTHGITAPKNVSVYETVLGVNSPIVPDHINILANGDVEIVVSDIPDGRFTGRVLIS